jgi:membrane protein implicated in regulation of membrane protease activity
MTWWSLWWVWMVGALLLAILEVVAPAQIFLGFAVGAAGVGLALLLGVPGLAGSVPWMALVFAVVSLVAWLVLRRALGIRDGQVKVFQHDINED